jgi:hypothetical protein
MTPENFCYWLQGFAELNGTAPTPQQWESIKEHLALVFNKVTSSVPVTEEEEPSASETASDFARLVEQITVDREKDKFILPKQKNFPWKPNDIYCQGDSNTSSLPPTTIC